MKDQSSLGYCNVAVIERPQALYQKYNQEIQLCGAHKIRDVPPMFDLCCVNVQYIGPSSAPYCLKSSEHFIYRRERLE